MKYSGKQLRQLWVNAGGPTTGNIDVLAAAVALAESGGRSDATHVNSDGSVDTGLWQINSVHGYSQSSLLNPITNARAAVAISQGGKTWTPWVTYTNGAFKSKLNAAAGIGGGPLDFLPDIGNLAGIGTGATNAVDSATNAISAPFNLAKDTINAITSSDFWFRVGKTVVGLWIAGFALNAIIKSATGVNPAGEAADVASTVVPIGKARSAVKTRKASQARQVEQARRADLQERQQQVRERNQRVREADSQHRAADRDRRTDIAAERNKRD